MTKETAVAGLMASSAGCAPALVAGLILGATLVMAYMRWREIRAIRTMMEALSQIQGGENTIDAEWVEAPA